MKIVLKSNGVFLRTRCCICGLGFDPDGAIAWAYEDGDDPNDRAIGAHVCRECIAAGPAGMKRRARALAHRAPSAETKRSASWLAGQTIHAPKLAAYELAIDRALVERCGKTREQLDAEQGADDGCPF
jgi:hypothetical protein